MPALLSCYKVAVPIETVPAIKIIHFNGLPKADEVYAYARLFAVGGALRFSFTRFEESPPATARMGVALAGAEDCSSFLFFSTAFDAQNSVCVYNSNGEILQNYSPINLQISHGGDEQGLYYTAEGEISAELLKQAINIELAPKAVLAGNIYSYDTTEGAFGSAFKTPALKSVPSKDGFEAIICVSY